MNSMEDTYYITVDDEPEKEVTEEEFCGYERRAGFMPKGERGGVATAGFCWSCGWSGSTLNGRVEHAKRKE